MKKLLITCLVCLVSATIMHGQKDPEMIKIAGGTFKMGDVKANGEPDERPVHSVTLKSFSLAKNETTVAQWKIFCAASKRKMPDAPAWGWTDSHPIINVSWEDAIAYCKWLSEKSGKTYRLPTEAEWEYAAKGGSKSRGFVFSGSNNLSDVAWFRDNSNGATHPVGTKKANELGLYDMSGNAWEWCNDFLDDYKPDSVNNPTGPVRGTFVLRRGGSWDDIMTRARCTYRIGNSFRRSYHSLGFRVAMSE